MAIECRFIILKQAKQKKQQLPFHFPESIAIQAEVFTMIRKNTFYKPTNNKQTFFSAAGIGC